MFKLGFVVYCAGVLFAAIAANFWNLIPEGRYVEAGLLVAGTVFCGFGGAIMGRKLK
jgi:hypothetical protein